MAALPNEDQAQFPDPLEFLSQDFIHPDNQAEIEHEQRRWRLLGWRERIRLELYVASLARKLKRGHYYSKVIEFLKLKKTFQAAKAEYISTTYISPEAKASARAQLLNQIERGKLLKAELADLHPTFEQWQHFAGWLDYEREHRHDLKIEQKRERQIRADMRKESRFLERIIYDVFRTTDGCHFHKPARETGGKEKTIVPKFERCVIKPDAHWFYLRTVIHIPIFGYRWRMPHGITTERLQEDDVVENLRAGLKRQCAWFWTDQNQLVLQVARLDAPDALPKHVMWRDGMKFYEEAKGTKFPYTIGVKESRKFHWLNFATDPSILVAGTSGSGKSNLVNGIIATLVSTHSPEELRLVLIDQKGGIEFTHWKDLPHLLWEMVKTSDEVKPVLIRLVAVMRKRMAMLEAVKAKDIAAYNARVDQEERLERLVIAIDEMSNFVGLGALTEEIHNLIMLLVSQGRAVGVHVIACTQHPEVKVIPGRIKTNMSVRLCGWMPTISSSQIVLDNPEAARLPKLPGRFVCARGMEVLTIQCPEITDEDIQGVVSAARQAYPDVANDIRDLAGAPAMVVWNEARVIKSAIEWTEGQLSAKKLNKLLADESPGERHLSKLTRSVVDLWTASGAKAFTVGGSEYTIKRDGKAYIVSTHAAPRAHDDDGDGDAVDLPDPELSPSTSPSMTAAAD